MAEGQELPGRGGGGILVSPEIFSTEYAVRCNLIHFETQL